MAKMLRDEKALPEAARMANDRKKLYLYGGIVFGTMIFGWMLKKFMNRGGGGTLTQGLSQSVMRFFFLMGIRFGVFLIMFGKHFGPAWKVFKTSFF